MNDADRIKVERWQASAEEAATRAKDAATDLVDITAAAAHAQATALVSIALSLSVIAEVVTAQLSDDA